jgi:hypothetical protein
MTPARRQTLTDAIDLITDVTRHDAWGMLADSTRAELMRIGATIYCVGNTNTIRLAGVTASCTWDAGEHLLTRWAANARTALEQDDGQA